MSKTRHATLTLLRNQVAKLSRAVATRLLCVDGVAWITVDGDQRDVVLERGQSFDIDSNADVIVCAIGGSAAIQVQGP